MGRGKIQLKRIEDKCSRQVSFSKRRKGIMKKAPELSVLCEVDVALFVFSGNNRLFEFSSGESSMTRILTRYQDHKNADAIVRRTVREKLAVEYRSVCTADELTQMIQRHLEEHKVQHSDITGLNRLEKEIGGVLQQVRTRKTQLMLGAVKALQEKQKELSKEKQLIVGEILAARLNQKNVEVEDQLQIPYILCNDAFLFGSSC